MRVAFTIIYEGLHHLKHRDFAHRMASMFDLWVIVEGFARNGGSTSWCNNLDLPHTSEDGTVEYIQEIASVYPNIKLHTQSTPYRSKDEQVNKAIQIIKTVTRKAHLWQVDADEHWEVESLEKAEAFADTVVQTGFTFAFDHMIGQDMVARGEWGSGTLNRMWKWSGQSFRSHEPALLVGQRPPVIVPDVKFTHYSYTFRKDVEFKSRYYKGHENVLRGFDMLTQADSFPLPISVLFGETKIGRSNTFIHKIKQHEPIRKMLTA